MACSRDRSRDCEPRQRRPPQPILAAAAPAPSATQALRFPVTPAAALQWGFPVAATVVAPSPDLDRELQTPPPPPPGRPVRPADDVDFVPETPPELLRAAASASGGAVPFNAGDGVPCEGGINSGLPAGGWLACFKRVEGEAHSKRAPAPQSDEGLEGGWVTVGSNRPRRAAFPPATFKPRSSPPEWIRGRCFHCLKPRHRASACRDPITCRRCFRSGHRACFCTNPPAPHLRPPPLSQRRPSPRPQAVRQQPRQPPRPVPPPPHLQSATSASAAPMAWSGDHGARPAEVFAIIHSTPSMLQEATVLEAHAVVAWPDRDLRASTQEVAAAFVKELGVLEPDISVVRHCPEAFLVRFYHQHHCTNAVGRREIPFGATKLQIRQWRLEAHAEHVDHRHHVRLCLEGLPLHAWEEQPSPRPSAPPARWITWSRHPR